MSGIRRRDALGMLAGAAGALGWSELALAQGKEAPRRGGTFVMAIGANPDHLNLSISSSVIIAFPGQAVTVEFGAHPSRHHLRGPVVRRLLRLFHAHR